MFDQLLALAVLASVVDPPGVDLPFCTTHPLPSGVLAVKYVPLYSVFPKLLL